MSQQKSRPESVAKDREPRQSRPAPVAYRVVGVNYRLIGITLGILLLLGVGSYFTRKMSIERNASLLLTEARKLGDSGRIAEAVGKISQFQSLKRGDAEAALLSAELTKRADLSMPVPWRAINDQLSNALTVNPNDPALLKESLLVAAEIGDSGAVVNQYAPLMEEELSTNPTLFRAAVPSFIDLNEADALVQTCLRAIDAKMPSVAPYQELIAQLGTQKTSITALSEIKRRFPVGAVSKDDAGERAPGALPADLAQLCRAVLAEMLAKVPPQELPKAQALMARFLAQQGNVAGAKQELEKGLLQSPNSRELRDLAVALLERDLYQARRAQRSRKDLSALEAKLLAALQKLAECPGLAPAEAHYSTAMLQMRLGNFEPAYNEFMAADQLLMEQPVPEDEGYDAARQVAAMKFNVRRNAMLAIPRLKKELPAKAIELQEWQQDIRKWLTDRKLPSEWQEFLDAVEDFTQEKWSLAAEKLEKLRPAFVSNQANVRRDVDLRLSFCHQEMGNPDSQIAVLKRGLDIDPEWPEGQLALVEALARSGRSEEARELGITAQRVLPEGDLRSVELELRRLLRQPDSDKDLRALLLKLDESAPAEGTPSESFVQLRTNLLWGLREHDQARSYLAELVERQGATPSLIYLQALAELSGREPPAGPNAAKQFLAKRGNDPAVDSPRLRMLKADLALREVEGEAPAILLAQAENLDRLSEAERVPLLIGLAEMATLNRANDAAAELVGRALEIDPNDVRVLWLATVMQQRMGRDAETIAKLQQRLEEIEGAGGPHASFTRGLGSRLKIRKLLETAAKTKVKPSQDEIKALLEESRKEFQQALKGRPSWREAHTQLAVAEWELGNQDAGYEQAQQAFELGERAPPVLGGMVQYLESRRRDADLLTLLQRAKDRGGVTPEVLVRGGVGALTRTGDVAGALNLLREVNDRSSGDGVFEAILMINRGEDLPRAERLLRDGLEGEFRQDAAASALVRLLVRQKRADEVPAVLKLAEEKINDVPPGHRALVLAGCYEVLGDLDKANELFASASKDDPANREAYSQHLEFLVRQRRFPEAMAMQQKLLKIAQAEGDEGRGAESAKLRLGMMTTDSARSYDQFEAGLEMITEGKPLPQLSVAALRALLRAYPRSNLKSDRERAIAVLDELGRRVALTANEQRLKAFLLQESGRWSDAWVLYKELMQKQPDDSGLLSTFVQAAATQKDPPPALQSDMERAVTTLLANEASSFRTAAARVRWMASAKREAEAIPVLQRFLARIESVEVESLFEELLRMRQAGYVRDLIGQMASDRKDPHARNVIAIAPQLLADPTSAVEVNRALDPYFEEPNVAKRVRDSMKLSVAEMYESLGALELAEQILLEVRKDWDGPGLEIVLAGFYSRQNRPEEALRIVEGLQNVSDSVVAQVGVGVLRAAKVETEQARPFEERMLKMRSVAGDKDDGNWQVATLALTDLYDHLERFDEAAKLYRELLAKNPGNVIALNNLAWLLAFSDQAAERDEAMKLSGNAIRAAGPVAELLDTRGVVLMQVGQAEQAVAALETAVRESQTANTHFHLAVAQLRAKRKADARQSFERALALGFEASKLHPLETGFLTELKSALEIASRIGQQGVPRPVLVRAR